ncbi:MAG: STAS domain-containing protein [Clostridia bacterium]|nr:STAS domain-containing protein [Clostridia bacterium]
MTINKTKNNTSLTLALEGRLETTTAPELEAVVKSELDGVTKLVFDFTSLDYVSSAGLRVLLYAQKIMNKQGEMKVVGANDIIKEIFDVTGFSEILTVE